MVAAPAPNDPLEVVKLAARGFEESWPALGDLRKQQARLQALLSEEKGRREALFAEMADIGGIIVSGNQSQAEKAKRAEFMVATGNFPSGAWMSRNDRLLEINQKIEDLNAALTLVSKNMRIERANASVKLCNELRPHHAELMADVIAAVLVLYQANARLLAFIDELDRRDIRSAGLKTVAATFLGDPRDNQGPVAWFLREVLEFGYIERDKVPLQLR